MYIRNDADGGLGNVKDGASVADLIHTPPSVRWLFGCVLQVIDPLDGATTPMVRAYAVTKLEALLSENPGVIELAIVCDDRNNPASVLANDQTIVTVHILFDSNRGEFVYSFSTKEFVNASAA